MACDLVLRTTNFKNELLNIILNQGGFEPSDRPDFNQIALMIINLNLEDREKILNDLLIASQQNFTVSTLESNDEHKLVWISNTNLQQIFTLFPDLKYQFEDFPLDITDNYTLILCSKMKINGEEKYGRTINSDGTEIFFIKGFYGAQLFLNYLKTKKGIQDTLKDGKLPVELSEYLSALNTIAEKRGTSTTKVLLDFINDKSSFRPFTKKGQYIVPSKILNGILHEINGTYNPNKGKSDIEIALNDLKLKHDNKWEYRLNLKDLYKLLSENNLLPVNDKNELISESEFLSYSLELMNDYLKNAFDDDPRLRRLEVSSLKIGEEGETKIITKNKKVTDNEVKLVWENYRTGIKNNGGDDYGNLNKALETIPGTVVNVIRSGFPNLKNVTVEVEELTKKDGKKAKKLIVKSDVDEAKTSLPKASYIILKTPYKNIGDSYGFTYDSLYIFNPVNEGSITNGKYNGAYIYEYFNEKTHTKHYAVSRHVISPYTYMSVYSSLEGAMNKIDNMNDTQIVHEYALHTIKTQQGRPRNVKLECGNFNIGLIITTLDINVPHIKYDKIPNFLGKFLALPCSDFKIAFTGINGIEKLDTPEKISAFIYIMANKMREGKSGRELRNVRISDDIGEFALQYLDEIESTIQYIDGAPSVSYQVESKKGNIANLVYLNHDGNDIQISGKFENGESATIVSNKMMDDAVNYFNKKFNINIQTKNRDAMLQFAEQVGLDTNLVDSIRAFVYNGEIYINSSNADISDLFHEISHIFLGRVKASDPEAYERIVMYYTNLSNFSSYKNYIDKKYRNFSLQDRIEESVADMIADRMSKNGNLSQDFKGELFLDDFKVIFERLPLQLKESNDSHPDLGFDYYLKGNKELDSKVIWNMKISNLVKKLIEDKLIKEIC